MSASLALAFAWLAGLAWACSAQAQTISPSQVTPHDFRPSAASSEAIQLPAAGGSTAPAGAERVRATLDRVSIEGGFPELASQSREATKALTGGPVSVAAVYAAANALERAYAAAGYVLVRVVAPPQRIEKHGALRLIVVDGFIEAIDVAGLPSGQRSWVAARMAPLVGLRHVRLSDIERRLLLAATDPGLVLRSTLSAGAAPGAAKLSLEAVQTPVSGTIGVDNHLPSALGVYALNASMALNSVFGLGEQVYATASSGYRLGELSSGKSPLELFGTGVSVPLGSDGLLINPEYTHSVSRPIPASGSPPSVGYFDRFDLRVSYPAILTRAQSLTLQGALEWDEGSLAPIGFGGDLYRDRYWVERLQADETISLPFGATAEALVSLSQGLGGRGGAASAASGVPASRQGASPKFTKADLTLRWTQALPSDIQLTVLARGQTSFGKPLYVSEAFSLEGPDALSGFASGTFSVDEGAVARAELGRSFPMSAGGAAATVAPYVFAGGGRGFTDEATAAQPAAVTAGSFGLGARTGFDFAGQPLGASLTLEAARFVSDAPGERAGWRGNISFQMRF